MGFAPVKPHGFPTFLHGKTTVFPTPFPDFQSITGTPSLPTAGRQRETKYQIQATERAPPMREKEKSPASCGAWVKIETQESMRSCRNRVQRLIPSSRSSDARVSITSITVGLGCPMMARLSAKRVLSLSQR